MSARKRTRSTPPTQRGSPAFPSPATTHASHKAVVTGRTVSDRRSHHRSAAKDEKSATQCDGKDYDTVSDDDDDGLPLIPLPFPADVTAPPSSVRIITHRKAKRSHDPDFDADPDSDDDDWNSILGGLPLPPVLRIQLCHRYSEPDEYGCNPIEPNVEHGAEVDAWLEEHCNPRQLSQPLTVLNRLGASVASSGNWMLFQDEQNRRLQALLGLLHTRSLDEPESARYLRLVRWFQGRAFARRTPPVGRHLAAIARGEVTLSY